MPQLYPAIEISASGRLGVGDGHSLYWESCGNARGKSALVIHGGPGSGIAPWQRRVFDTDRYRVVLYDQRNCGRSTPHASDPDVDLGTNTTGHLVADIERLREHLAIDRWLILGGSWGSMLALAYAEAHPARVTELILFGVTAGLHREFDSMFRGGLSELFPAQWQRLCEWVLAHRSTDPAPGGDMAEAGSAADVDVLESVHELLFDPDPGIRRDMAYEWCLWESATPQWPPTAELQPRFRDPDYALAFARIVTHYARHDGWLDDGVLLDGLMRLVAKPMILIDGRHDPQSTEAAAEISRRLPLATHIVVDDASYTSGNEGIAAELVRATDRFASR